jgi:hypothetical protein
MYQVLETLALSGLELNTTVVWLAFLLISEILGLNLSTETNY